MGEPARKIDAEADIQPKLYSSKDPEQDSANRRSTFRDLNTKESNPTQSTDKSVAEQEADGSNIVHGPWANNVADGGKNIIKSGGMKSFVKKKSPMLAIILTLIGGGIGIGGLLSPSLLLVHIKETLFQDLDDASSALEIRTNVVLHKKLDGVKNAFSESKAGKCNILCKFGSINETELSNLKSKGFEITTEKSKLPGRSFITELKFPNGDKATNGAEFNKLMNKNENAVAFKSVYNSKTAYFLNSKFGTILKSKFKLDKISKLKADITEKVNGKLISARDSVKESIRAAVGLPEIDVNAAPKQTATELARNDPRFTAAFESIDKLNGFSSKATNAIGWVCSAYDVANGIKYATKAAKIAALAGFAMIFLNAADQIKAGDADPDVISTLGDQLTQTDTNGKSATDALGYKMAAYGENGTLTDEDKQYSSGPSNGLLGILGSALALVGVSASAAGGAGLKAGRFACKAGGNPLLSIAQDCPEEVIAAAAAATATGIETLGVGAAVSAAAGAVVCIGKMAITGAIFSAGISKVIAAAIGLIANSDVPKLDEGTRGTALGDTLYSGSAQIMGGTAAAYGLQAGTKAQIKQYAIDTASIKRQNDTVAKYEAKDTPFDAYNRYSFLGSIVSTIDLSGLYNSSSPLSYVGTILSIIPKSMATLSSNVGATANTKADRYGKCDDPSLNSKGLGIDADVFCNPSYVMSSGEMNADIDTVTNYMIDNGYIDGDTGEATGTVPTIDLVSGTLSHSDNQYQNYLAFCANRVDPLGETSGSIADDNYEWEVGTKCQDQSEMMSNFRTYTMDKSINDTMDEDLSAASSASSSNNGSSTISKPSTVSAGTVKYCTANYGKNDSQAGMKKVYGSTASAIKADLVGVEFPFKSGNKTIQFNKKAAPCLKAVASDLSNVSFRPTTFSGSFDWRTNRNNTSVLSYHSFGIALDLDASNNPNGGGSPGHCKTNMPADFVAVFKKYGFRWGGDYHTTCDAMHFEWLGG